MASYYGGGDNDSPLPVAPINPRRTCTPRVRELVFRACLHQPWTAQPVPSFSLFDSWDADDNVLVGSRGV